MQQGLGFPHVTQPNPPARPSLHSDRVLTRTVMALLPEVLAWMGPDAPTDDENGDITKIAHDLLTAMQTAGSLDGFELAYTLRSNGWAGDRELVEIMDQADTIAYRHLRDFEIEWVKANGMLPHFKVGDIVRVTVGRLYCSVGPIVEVRTDTGEYMVQTADWRMRNPTAESGGMMIKFENAALADEAFAA
jgi:hypothetical protein